MGWTFVSGGLLKKSGVSCSQMGSQSSNGCQSGRWLISILLNPDCLLLQASQRVESSKLAEKEKKPKPEE